eukprot:SM000162S02350  [mRNA]  locus=s162:32891:36337:- [translate_table: standard]
MPQAGDPKFAFLFGGDPGSDADVGCQFYEWKKAQLREQIQAVDAVPGARGLVPSQGSQPTAQSQQEEPMSPASSDAATVADDAVQHLPSVPNVQLSNNNLDRAAAPSSLPDPAAEYSSSTRPTSAAAVPGTGKEREGRGEAGDGFAVARKQQPAAPPPPREHFPPSTSLDERLPPPPRPGRRKTGFDRPAMEEVGAEQSASAQSAPDIVAADAPHFERKQEPDRSNPERTSSTRTRQCKQSPRRTQGKPGEEEALGRADKVNLAGPRPGPSDGKDSSRGAGGGRTDGHKEELEKPAAVDEFGRLQRPGGNDSDSDLGSPGRRKDGRRTEGPWPRTSRSPVPANRHRRSPDWRHSPRSRRDRSSSPQIHVSRGREGDRREPLQRGTWQPPDREGGGRGPRDSRGGRVNACFHFARGHCARGDSCKFLHTRTSDVTQGPEAGRDRYNAGRARESDTTSSRRGPDLSQGRQGGHAAGRAEGDEWYHRNRSTPEGPPHVDDGRRDPSASPRSREARRRADGLRELPANAAAQTDPRPVGREPGGAVLRAAQLGSWSPSLEPTPSSHAQSTSPGPPECISGRGGKALVEQGSQDVTSDERRTLATADHNRLAGSSAGFSDTPHTRQAQQQHQRHTDAGPQPLTQGTNSGWQDCPPVWHRGLGQPRESSPAGHMHATSGLDAASKEGRLQSAAVESRPEQQDSRPWAVAEARATHVAGSQALIVPQGAGNGGRLNGSTHFEEDRPATTVALHVNDAGLSEGIDRLEPAGTMSTEETEKRLQVMDVEMAEPVRKEAKGAHLLRVAIAEWVKEELKSAWKEKRLTKEGFKLVAKKAVDKVVGALQPHQVPQSSHQVQAFFTSAQKDKMAKLVKGYVEKHRKAQT